MATPDRKTLKTVDKYNEVLRAELGNPVYSWQWSGALRIAVRKEDELGQPAFEYQSDPESGLLVAQPMYFWREICAPKVVDQWVLCRKAFTPQSAFRRMFGTTLIWPENGEWQPLTAGPSYVALNPGKNPDHEETWEVIRMIRAEREVTTADVRHQTEDLIAKREKVAEANRRSFIRDRIPAFGGVPGQKLDYSFGGFEAETKNKARTDVLRVIPKESLGSAQPKEST